MVFSIIFALLGIYSIFMGVKTLLTGTISAREEAKIANYSKKGARIYKLSYAVTSIIGGLAIIGVSVIRFLEYQKILDNTLPYMIGILIFVVIMAVILFVIHSKCKTMTDD